MNAMDYLYTRPFAPFTAQTLDYSYTNSYVWIDCEQTASVKILYASYSELNIVDIADMVQHNIVDGPEASV